MHGVFAKQFSRKKAVEFSLLNSLEFIFLKHNAESNLHIFTHYIKENDLSGTLKGTLKKSLKQPQQCWIIKSSDRDKKKPKEIKFNDKNYRQMSIKKKFNRRNLYYGFKRNNIL